MTYAIINAIEKKQGGSNEEEEAESLESAVINSGSTYEVGASAEADTTVESTEEETLQTSSDSDEGK